MKKICLILCLFIAVGLCGCSPIVNVDDNVEYNAENANQVDKSELVDNTDDNNQEVDNEQTFDADDEQTFDEVNEENYAYYVRSKVDGLAVRKGNGTSYSVVGRLDKGDMVVYLSKEGDWYKTYYKNVYAYVSANSSYTETAKLRSGGDEVESVINEGVKLLGMEYVYGAVRLHNGKGVLNDNFDVTEFDCSSLMQYIFYCGADELLQVNTRTQIYQGETVGTADLRRGDLMFFTNSSRKNNVGIERVGHVALYLGDNYILHTASDYAVIEQISATRWSYFIQAQRIID